MAKRSDFAQKLLDDLRLRKERMASSRSSNTSNNPTFADAYAYTKRGYTGSRELKKPETISSRGGGTSNRSISGTEIVPFGRPLKPEQMGDLSMVLSFALENGGKITRVESSGNKSFFKFLQQIGKRRMGLGKTEKRTAVVTLHQSSNSQLPALSHLQVEKISNGVQKLNQVLQVYGNGTNFDRYSIEIGKELLKGAMDLEESLQMLVSLQEASEYMTTPRKKSTLTLLEDDGDDDSTVKIELQKQLARSDSKLRQAGITFSYEASKFNHEKDQVSAASRPRYHKRSVSYSSDMKTTPASFSEEKHQNAPQSKQPEKGRISNVVAKLMGLDDTPGNAGSKGTKVKESSSKPRTEGMILRRNVKESTKVEETTKVNTALVPSTVKQKEIKSNSNNTPESQASQIGRIQVKNQPLKDFQDIKPVSSSMISANKVEKQEKNIVQVNHHIGGRYESREERKQQTKAELHLHRRSKSEINLSQGNTQEKKRVAEEMDRQKLQDRRHGENESAPSNSSSPIHIIAATQHKRLRLPNQGSAVKKGSTEAKHNTSSSTRKHLTEQINGTRTADPLDVTNQGDHSSGRSLANHNPKMKDSKNENFNWKSTEEDQKAKDGFTQPVGNRTSDVQTRMKARSVRVQKLEMPPKVNEVMGKKGGNAANFSGPVKHQTLMKEDRQTRQVEPIISREVDFVKTSRSKEVEVPIIKSQKPIPSSAATPSVEEAIQSKTEQDPNLPKLVDDKCESLSELQTLAATDNSQNETSRPKNDQQDEESGFSRHEEFKTVRSIISNEADIGPCNEKTKSCVSRFNHFPTFIMEIPSQLTESENQLKQILVKNQLFVNTAEALFKLNIPFSVLQASEPGCQDVDSKLLLDCSYEVMKRKGKRKELRIHPFVKATITSSTRVKTLDDLIRQLQKDLHSLKSYGGDGNSEGLFGDLLHKMMESDMYYKDADLNCMWDCGWNDMMFMFHEKDDVTRDVERQVIDGLIDEVTRDLYCTSISVSA